MTAASLLARKLEVRSEVGAKPLTLKHAASGNTCTITVANFVTESPDPARPANRLNQSARNTNIALHSTELPHASADALLLRAMPRSRAVASAAAQAARTLPRRSRRPVLPGRARARPSIPPSAFRRRPLYQGRARTAAQPHEPPAHTRVGAAALRQPHSGRVRGSVRGRVPLRRERNGRRP